MTMQEFIAYQERTFDSYCKRLIRNESRDANKELSRRAKREVSISDTANEALKQLHYHDTYHLEKVTVHAGNNEIETEDILLGQAIMQLPPKLRVPILLIYFHDLSETQISRMLKVTPRTINRRKNKGLAMLKKILERLEYYEK